MRNWKLFSLLDYFRNRLCARVKFTVQPLTIFHTTKGFITEWTKSLSCLLVRFFSMKMQQVAGDSHLAPRCTYHRRITQFYPSFTRQQLWVTPLFEQPFFFWWFIDRHLSYRCALSSLTYAHRDTNIWMHNSRWSKASQRRVGGRCSQREQLKKVSDVIKKKKKLWCSPEAPAWRKALWSLSPWLY